MLSRSFPLSLNLSRQVFHTICSSSYHSFIHNLNYYRKLRLYSVTCLSLSSSLFKSKDEPGTCLHTFVENYFGYTSKWWDVIFASLSRRQLREAKWSNDLYKLYLAPVSQRSWVQIPYGPELFEPMTSAIPVQRSTNWAKKPTGSCSICWVQINHPSDE